MNEGISQAIDAMGGRGALAQALGVSEQAIWQWLNKKVPAKRAVEIEELTKGAVRCEDMRPDIKWEVLRHSSKVRPSKAMRNSANS